MSKRVLVLAILLTLLGLLLFMFLPSKAALAYPSGWTLQQQITGSHAVTCDIDAFQNYVFAVWQRDDGAICFRRSTDAGATWAPYVIIENSAYNNGPAIVCVGSATYDAVYVVWAGKRNGNGYYQTWVARSNDWGATFPAESRWHSTGNFNRTDHDACRWDTNNVIAYAFCSDESGTGEIRWGKIQVDGTVSSGNAISANDSIVSHNPVIACNGNADAMVLWTDEAGGPYTRRHLVANRTVDSGETWGAPGSGPLPYDSNYRQGYPSIFWESHHPVVAYQGQSVTDSHYFFGRFYFNPVGASWMPSTVAQSERASTSTVPTCPETVGFAAGDCFFKNTSNMLTEWDTTTQFFGAKTVAANNRSISLCSIDHTNDYAIHYASALTTDGEIFVRRVDLSGTEAVLTSPTFNGSDPVFLNANFTVECGDATDDFNVTGSDLVGPQMYSRGFKELIYSFSEDEVTWQALPCAGGVNNIATTAPFAKVCNTDELNQRTIKIKTTTTDTAGNTAEWISPWIYIDKNPPLSSLKAVGTEGTGGYYRSNVSTSFTVSDFSPCDTFYKVENLGNGQIDSNWTLFSTPFELAEGKWKVHFYSEDRAGNIEETRTADVFVDKTSPVPSVTRPSKDTIQTGYYNNESFRITGTATDANGLSWAAIYVDGERKYETTSSFNMAYVWPLGGVPEGTHRITVKAKDRAGNMGTGSKNVFLGNVARDWYFPEGSTLPEFDEWLCVLNPGDNPARYQVSFMLETGEVRTFERSMMPHQRDTVRVKDYVGEPHSGVSTKIHSDSQAIVAERPMYFVYKYGVPNYYWKGGHDVMGINTLQREWYFAEGTTRNNSVDGAFEEWICLQNPSDSQTATVVVTYMLGTGQNVDKVYQVAPHSRYTVEVARDIGLNQDVSAKVVSDIPIAAERPIYFNYHGFAIDGSNVVGASGPSKSWSFAEGCTRPGFQEWITIQNPNDVAATCTLNYMTGQGKTTRVVKRVNPRSRATVDVLSEVGDNQDVSATVTSDVPVIAERPMYFIYGMDSGKYWNGGESAVGNPSPSSTYFLAEGTTISRFDTFYSLANPRETGCDVTVQYIFGDGSTHDSHYFIEPHSRITINVREAIQREANVSGSITASFPIVIERPMYFQYNESITGGHDVNGYGVD